MNWRVSECLGARTTLRIKQQRGWLCCFTKRSGSWFNQGGAYGLWGPGTGDKAGKALWCPVITTLYVLLNNMDFILKATRGF